MKGPSRSALFILAILAAIGIWLLSTVLSERTDRARASLAELGGIVGQTRPPARAEAMERRAGDKLSLAWVSQAYRIDRSMGSILHHYARELPTLGWKPDSLSEGRDPDSRRKYCRDGLAMVVDRVSASAQWTTFEVSV